MLDSPRENLIPSYRIRSPLPPSLLHGEYLHHSDKDVDEVEFERNALVDRVALHQASLRHPSVGQDLLDVVEREAREYRESFRLVSMRFKDWARFEGQLELRESA